MINPVHGEQERDSKAFEFREIIIRRVEMDDMGVDGRQSRQNLFMAQEQKDGNGQPCTFQKMNPKSRGKVPRKTLGDILFQGEDMKFVGGRRTQFFEQGFDRI